MKLPGTTLTRGATFEVWPLWYAVFGLRVTLRYVPDLHYRRDRIGD